MKGPSSPASRKKVTTKEQPKKVPTVIRLNLRAVSGLGFRSLGFPALNDSEASKGGVKVGGIFLKKSPYKRDASSYLPSSHLLRPRTIRFFFFGGGGSRV